MTTYLRDRDFLLALSRDIAQASDVHLSVVSLTRQLRFLFVDFLLRGGSLTVATNSLSRYPDSTASILAEVAELRDLGAHVVYYNSPYLLHAKLIAIAPNIVYIGSHNLTGQSMGRNIERSVRLMDPALFSDVLADIKLWSRGPK
jgi:phosphatidylserine/phosphatidylglycerophosphate/cardiolipin synthase-like enzyme